MGKNLGINLSGISRWSSELPFLDHFKTAGTWMAQTKTGQNLEGVQLNLDANGWVKSLPKSGDGKYDRVTVLLDAIPNVPGVKENYPGGKYVVLYEGEGTLKYGFDATLDTTASKAGRHVINVKPSEKGFAVTITETDPKKTGNYIRNIRIVPEAYENTYKTQVFNPKFLEKIDDFSTLRFMDYMGTNNSKQGDWKNRPTTGTYTYAYFNQGVPVEVMIDLANRTGTNPWFNIPHQATDEYITNFAKIVKEKLNPNLKVYVENSNEVWNGGFNQHQWAQQQGQKLGGDWKDWHSRRTEQIGDKFDAILGKDRVVTVLGSDNGNLKLSDELMKKVKAYDPNSTVDAIAIAPYMGLRVFPKQDSQLTKSEAEVEGWTRESDGGLNKVFDYLNKVKLPAQVESITKQKELANKYGVDLVAYEGGQHFTGHNGVENNQAITNLIAKSNRDPRMGQLYKEYLKQWDQITGGGEFVMYNDISAPSKWGAFGSLEHVNQSTSPKWEALKDFLNSPSNSKPKPVTTNTGSSSSGTISGKKPTKIGTDGNDVFSGTEGNDVLDGGKGNDKINGLQGDDEIRGGDGNDDLNSGSGNDILTGGLGDDLLWGKEGNDILNGDSGNDRLTGGSGADRLTGGAGRDQFIYFDILSKGDTITDFKRGEDVIDLRQIMSGSSYGGTNKFSKYLKLEQSGSDTVVRLDIDGNTKLGGFDKFITLANTKASELTASSFVF